MQAMMHEPNLIFRSEKQCLVSELVIFYSKSFRSKGTRHKEKQSMEQCIVLK